MFCIISYIFVFIVLGQLEAEMITFGQAILYISFGLLMFYQTSKPYWVKD